MKIIHGMDSAYQVVEYYRYSCRACRAGWDAGLKLPADGGRACTHGRGMWQAGKLGPRGGWHGIGPNVPSRQAAMLICDALNSAVTIPAEGVE